MGCFTRSDLSLSIACVDTDPTVKNIRGAEITIGGGGELSIGGPRTTPKVGIQIDTPVLSPSVPNRGILQSTEGLP